MCCALIVGKRKQIESLPEKSSHEIIRGNMTQFIQTFSNNSSSVHLYDFYVVFISMLCSVAVVYKMTKFF